MSFLIIDAERYALQLGDTTLGGDADELLAPSMLGTLPPFAVITTGIEDVATIRALPGAPDVRLRGQSLTTEPTALHHGDRLNLGPMTILYGDVRAAGRTSPVRGVTVQETDLLQELSYPEPTAPTGGRLVSRSDGASHEIPAEGLVIGRDPECGLVVNSGSVSRRHAVIVAALLGYAITDESTNGVIVNSARIGGATLLRQGDIVRVGDAEFRFEADRADFEPHASLRPAAPPSAAALPPASPTSQAPPPLLATLEVLARGVDEGCRFRIERATVQLGRAPHNDVRIADESVSAAHATLLRRGASWHLLDLGSRNGTYVDGERVGDHELPSVCEVRLGNVKLLFRAIGGGTPQDQATRGIVGIGDDRLRGRRSGT